MTSTLALIDAVVMHKRLFPKVNYFKYKILYFIVPITKDIQHKKINNSIVSKLRLIRFCDKKHGDKGKSSLYEWIFTILTKYNLHQNITSIDLISMPKFLGYVFNPVSFWVCKDSDKNVRCVLCEVNNTFGETHYYICTANNNQPITKNNVIKTKKIFHVSPFLKREGSYKFRFDFAEKSKIEISIDYYDKDNNKQLITAVSGDISQATNANMFKSLFKYPLLTFKVIYLIHWQALKLISKKIKFIKKPKQNDTRVS